MSVQHACRVRFRASQGCLDSRQELQQFLLGQLRPRIGVDQLEAGLLQHAHESAIDASQRYRCNENFVHLINPKSELDIYRRAGRSQTLSAGLTHLMKQTPRLSAAASAIRAARSVWPDTMPRLLPTSHAENGSFRRAAAGRSSDSRRWFDHPRPG